VLLVTKLIEEVRVTGIVLTNFRQVMTNFGFSKADLCLRFRLGVEHALAKADFLNTPDMTQLQALIIFLTLARRHDSPKFVYMMTGLALRIARYLGLHRDGMQLEHLTAFEVHMRRKLWWLLCFIEVRTAEDQGTEVAITAGSFDTKAPSNIDDRDIDPDSRQMPMEKSGVTDSSFPRIIAGLIVLHIEVMDARAKEGLGDLEARNRLLGRIIETYEAEYLQYSTESETGMLGKKSVVYWV
jgi:hypothetical protein